MNIRKALGISASALSAQRVRMNVIASNLANVNTTRTPAGGPYQKKSVIFSAQPLETGFKQLLQTQFDGQMRRVEVLAVVDERREGRRVFDPNHPDADRQGYVTLPNVNVVEEMVDLLSAQRSYEANVTAISATKAMARKALEIGQR